MSKDIIPKIHLLDFYEKKTDTTNLVDLKELKSLVAIYREKHTHNHNITIPNIHRTIQLLINLYPLVDEILDFSEGKILLCGLAVKKLLNRESFKECNMYIHSCTTFEADILVKHCIELVKGCYSMYDNYISLITDDYRICLFLEVYKDKEQVLRYNESLLEKCGWDYDVGAFYCTISCAITMILGITLAEHNPLFKDIVHTFYNINKDITGHVNVCRVTYEFDSKVVSSLRLIKYDTTPKREKFKGTTIFVPSYLPNLILKKLIDEHVWRDCRFTTIGISDDKYIALNNVAKKFNINKDILNLLCRYWLEEEAKLAKRKLLGYKD